MSARRRWTMAVRPTKPTKWADMKEDISELKMRCDILTGGCAAMHALLLALLETHPNPQQLSEVFEVFLQRTLAHQTNTPYGDGVLGGIHELARQYKEQAQLRTQT